MTDPVRIGSAVIAYIEPHDGLAREFNRWYEGDHYYAAVMAGPGAFAGSRWVATRACKAQRPPGTLFGDPARGSYLTTAWVLDGAQGQWDAWVAREMEAIAAQGRLFAGRDHLHTAIYRYAGEAHDPHGPPATFALDRCYPGIVAVAAEVTPEAAQRWMETVVSVQTPVAVAFTPERVLMSQAEPNPHVLVLVCCAADVLVTWRARIAPRLERLGAVGFASPFLRTVPGSETYTDQL